jgi:hypothetical protein
VLTHHLLFLFNRHGVSAADQYLLASAACLSLVHNLQPSGVHPAGFDDHTVRRTAPPVHRRKASSPPPAEASQHTWHTDPGHALAPEPGPRASMHKRECGRLCRASGLVDENVRQPAHVSGPGQEYDILGTGSSAQVRGQLGPAGRHLHC